jgi:hypothetical protein
MGLKSLRVVLDYDDGDWTYARLPGTEALAALPLTVASRLVGALG